MVQPNYIQQRGPSVGGAARFTPRDNGPKPEPKETGNRIWKLVHSYKVGETFANTTAVAQLPGGCLVRTCSRNARGCAEALCFVPGAKLADFAATGGAR